MRKGKEEKRREEQQKRCGWVEQGEHMGRGSSCAHPSMRLTLPGEEMIMKNNKNLFPNNFHSQGGEYKVLG